MFARRFFSLPAAAILLSVALTVAGCSAQPQSNPNAYVQPDNAAAEAQAKEKALALAAQKTCITNATNDAVLKVQSDAATQIALDGQDLTNCPADFVSAFVALRTSVRNYLQSHHEVIAHSGEADAAGSADLLNLGCSIIAGKQCAPSAVGNWMDVDADLKNRDAVNRAAYQKKMDELEAVIARYGLYIRKPQSTPTPSGDNMAPDAGNAM